MTRDYAYYEERAPTVKLEDITSSDLNAKLLRWIKDDNPEWNKAISLTVDRSDETDFCIDEGDDLGWLGFFIGQSDFIKELNILHLPAEQIDEFVAGLNRNQSMKQLDILSDEFILEKIGPLFRVNKNLTDLSLHVFPIGEDGARNLALILDNTSLESISLEYNDLAGEDFCKEIAMTLGRQTRLKKLRINDNRIGRVGCVLLGEALARSRVSSLRVLLLCDVGIHDDGLQALIAGLAYSIDLEVLSLNGNSMITTTGLAALSAFFQSRNCDLRELDLSYMNIGDDGMNCLVPGLATLQSLRELGIGWNRFGDEGLQTVLDMPNATKLEEINLSGNRFTAVGLASMSPLLQSESCLLKKLYLLRTNFGDDGVEALGSALAGNKSLTCLSVSSSDVFMTESYGFVESEWKVFKRILCDTSSINNTYLSNHTITEVGTLLLDHPPPDIQTYLRLNKTSEKIAAQCKILMHHPVLDMKPFFQWKLKILPLMIDWFNRAHKSCDICKDWISEEETRSIELHTVYQFIRDMPMLVVKTHCSQKKSRSRKRKIDLRRSRRISAKTKLHCD
eukprot:scaffold20067_cov134-Skeletonema_dohrnii-CCMP3373.AAC.4